MGDEVVDRLLDRFAVGELLEMVGEQVVVEGVGVVPVEASALVEGELGEVAVVGVHVDERDGECAEVVGDFAGDGGFAAAGSAGDADDEGLGHATKLRHWAPGQRLNQKMKIKSNQRRMAESNAIREDGEIESGDIPAHRRSETKKLFCSIVEGSAPPKRCLPILRNSPVLRDCF